MVDGSVNVWEFNKEMDWNFFIEGFKIFNGLIFEYLEEIFDSNVSLCFVGYFIEIIDINENMIKIVRVMFEFYKFVFVVILD